MKAYLDTEGNTYRVEHSGITGKFIVMRTNAGGNRKRFKLIAESRSRENSQRMLDALASQSEWRETV